MDIYIYIWCIYIILIYIYVCMCVCVDLFICLFSEEDWDAYWKCHQLQRAAKVTPRLAIFFLVYITSLISHFTFRFTIHFTTDHYQNRSSSDLLCRPFNSKNQHFLRFYYLWNFRHRLVWYYWYQLIKMKQRFPAAFRWWFGLQAWHRHDFLENCI